MKYLFFLIFFLNITFYIFLINKPLNIESDFSIKAGNNLNEIFTNLEEKNIYFPKGKLNILRFQATTRPFSMPKIVHFPKGKQIFLLPVHYRSFAGPNWCYQKAFVFQWEN